jgi:hypothetical protein
MLNRSAPFFPCLHFVLNKPCNRVMFEVAVRAPVLIAEPKYQLALLDTMSLGKQLNEILVQKRPQRFCTQHTQKCLTPEYFEFSTQVKLPKE